MIRGKSFVLAFLIACLLPSVAKAASVVEETQVGSVKEYVISPAGSEDTSNVLKKCLQSNGNDGVKVTLQPGNYDLRYTLQLYSNTTIIAEGATITQTSAGRYYH